MSVFNDEIDLEVLEFALKRYADRIPKTELQTLKTYIQAWKQEQPNSAQTLCRFVFESESIDLAYDHALTDLRRHYQTQERTKSAILTAQSPNTPNGLGTIADELLQQLDHLLNPAPIASNSKMMAYPLSKYFGGESVRQSTEARHTTNQSTSSVWENADRIAIMASGGAFLGGAIVQLLGGGVTQFIGVSIGAIVGAYSGWKVGPSEPRRKS